jgi:hypothetical protein
MCVARFSEEKAMTRYISFDIEIVKEIPTGTDDWTSLRPLGISVASTLDSETGQVDLWYHGMDQKTPLGGPMDQGEAQRLVNYLFWAQEERGRKILTWNGLSFDFDVLAEESGLWQECAQLARGHIDMMLQFFCMKGYAVGLEAVSKGLGLAGKTEGMHGDLAPVMWAQGKYETVMQYVTRDTAAALEVANALLDQKAYKWTSKNGNSMTVPVKQLLTVEQSLALPEPNVKETATFKPWKRTKFTGWLERLPTPENVL